MNKQMQALWIVCGLGLAFCGFIVGYGVAQLHDASGYEAYMEEVDARIADVRATADSCQRERDHACSHELMWFQITYDEAVECGLVKSFFPETAGVTELEAAECLIKLRGNQ